MAIRGSKKHNAPAVFELRSASMTLVVVALKTTDMAAIEAELNKRFGETPEMFNHDPVVIDVAAAEGDAAGLDFARLATLLRGFRMLPAAVRGGTAAQMAAALAAGLGSFDSSGQTDAELGGQGVDRSALSFDTSGRSFDTSGRTEEGADASVQGPMVSKEPAAPGVALPVRPEASHDAHAPHPSSADPEASQESQALNRSSARPEASQEAQAPNRSSARPEASQDAQAPDPSSAHPEVSKDARAPSLSSARPEVSKDAHAPHPSSAHPEVSKDARAPTLIVDKPLRSGQQVYARGGDLVVLAAVNFGAEVIADGSIHVYAPLRGKAIAGAKGDTSARIFSTCMEPELIAIAGTYRTTDNPLPANVLGKPAQIRLDGERLVFEPLA